MSGSRVVGLISTYEITTRPHMAQTPRGVAELASAITFISGGEGGNASCT